jgi:type IV secretory pathway VirB10-like protein
MSKPAIVVLGTLGVIALAVLLGVFALRARRPSPTPPEAQDSVAAAIPSQPAAPAAKPAPPLPAPLVAGPRLRKPAEPDAGKRLDETSLMAKLHDLAASDPPLSLQLAKEALVRFPDSPNAPEFEWNLVKALSNMEHYKEAEEAARVMVKKYPGNDFAADVDRHLLNHPPNPLPVPPN